QRDLQRAEGKGRVEPLTLRDVAERTAPAVEAVLDRAGQDGQESDDAPEQGRLAGTVGSEKCDELAALEIEGDVLQDGLAPVTQADVAQFDETQEALSAPRRRFHERSNIVVDERDVVVRLGDAADH